MTRRRCRTRRRRHGVASGRARRGGASWASWRARRRARETAAGRARRPSESGSRVRLLQRRRRPSECPRGSCRIPRGCRASDSPAAGPSWRVASDAGHSLPWDFTAVAARCRLRALAATALLFRRVWHTRWSLVSATSILSFSPRRIAKWHEAREEIKHPWRPIS